MEIKAFCFDVFGTVVDWRSGVAREAVSFFEKYNLKSFDGFSFADAWRGRYQGAMQACRDGVRPYTRLDVLHRENLEAVLRDSGLDPHAFAEEDLRQLNFAWHRLDPWPDAVAGLTRLKARYIIAPASNGNMALMVNMAKRAGLPWDAILGAEATQAYKPSPQAYLRMVDILGLEPAQVCMTAAHNDDLAAARACGLSTAFVPRPTERGVGQIIDLAPTQAWDLIAQDFNDLAAQVGC